METYMMKVIYDDNRKTEKTACATLKKAMELAQKKMDEMKPNKDIEKYFPQSVPCTTKAINAYKTVLNEEYDVYIKQYGRRILIERIPHDGNFGGKIKLYLYYAASERKIWNHIQRYISIARNCHPTCKNNDR